jgi:imidazole glycerol-phosphate synthase subunit HisH
MKKICILDYGMGNIASLSNAIKKLGYTPELYSEKEEINSNILFLPGVGAFNSAMKIIKQKSYDRLIYSFIEKNDNLLFGICLGMQILFNSSNENNNTEGLNLINGEVSKLQSVNKIKLPHVGLNEIKIINNNKFNFIKNYDKKKFYFVHSYAVKTLKEKNTLATSTYKDIDFSSIVTNNNNIIGTQFHPEKSSKIGLNFLEDVLKNFN